MNYLGMGTYVVMFEEKPGDDGMDGLAAHLTLLGGIEIMKRMWILRPSIPLDARGLAALAASALDDAGSIFVSELGRDRMGRNLTGMGALFW